MVFVLVLLISFNMMVCFVMKFFNMCFLSGFDIIVDVFVLLKSCILLLIIVVVKLMIGLVKFLCFRICVSLFFVILGMNRLVMIRFGFIFGIILRVMCLFLVCIILLMNFFRCEIVILVISVLFLVSSSVSFDRFRFLIGVVFLFVKLEVDIFGLGRWM